MTDENARPRRSRAGGKPDTQLMPPPEQVDDHRRDLLKDLIRQQVLHDLGEPVGLLRVQVRPLWDDHYRVNVFVGADAACATILHSYFVESDADGNVLYASPKVRKQY